MEGDAAAAKGCNASLAILGAMACGFKGYFAGARAFTHPPHRCQGYFAGRASIRALSAYRPLIGFPILRARAVSLTHRIGVGAISRAGGFPALSAYRPLKSDFLFRGRARFHSLTRRIGIGIGAISRTGGFRALSAYRPPNRISYFADARGFIHSPTASAPGLFCGRAAFGQAYRCA